MHKLQRSCQVRSTSAITSQFFTRAFYIPLFVVSFLIQQNTLGSQRGCLGCLQSGAYTGRWLVPGAGHPQGFIRTGRQIGWGNQIGSSGPCPENPENCQDKDASSVYSSVTGKWVRFDKPERRSPWPLAETGESLLETSLGLSVWVISPRDVFAGDLFSIVSLGDISRRCLCWRPL